MASDRRQQQRQQECARDVQSERVEQPCLRLSDIIGKKKNPKRGKPKNKDGATYPVGVVGGGVGVGGDGVGAGAVSPRVVDGRQRGGGGGKAEAAEQQQRSRETTTTHFSEGTIGKRFFSSSR
jgi:hypothetical protein